MEAMQENDKTPEQKLWEAYYRYLKEYIFNERKHEIALSVLCMLDSLQNRSIQDNSPEQKLWEACYIYLEEYIFNEVERKQNKQIALSVLCMIDSLQNPETENYDTIR